LLLLLLLLLLQLLLLLLQLSGAVCKDICSGCAPADASSWTDGQLHSFLHHTVRSFLRNDLYSALTELLTRAEGSFGVTAYW
jgi:hypothetical protein